MADDFAGGVAVITGAGAGIGAGLAREAGRRGMKVVVTDVSKERAEAVAADIVKAGGTAQAIPVDVRESAAVEELAGRVHAELGDVRLLVNNAGIGTYGLSWELTHAQWENVMQLNVNGIYYGIKAFVPHMLEAGKNAGRSAIVNLSSLGGLAALPLTAPYIVSKHAILALSECLYLEMQLVNAPIDVSVIVPSMINSKFFDDVVVAGSAHQALTKEYARLMKESAGSIGMSPDDAAKVMFKQIEAREFWISTDFSVTKATADGRAEFLRTQARPQLPGPVRDTLKNLKASV
jgi:short-subunit dehydrogenase